MTEEVAGDPAPAAGWYEIVARTDPTFTAASFGLARCRTAMGDRAGAIAAYGWVLDTSSAHADALMAQAELLLDGAGPGDVADLVRAASLIEQVPADREQRGPLAARVLERALAAVREGRRRRRRRAVLGVPLARARPAARAGAHLPRARPARRRPTPSASRSSTAPTPCVRGRGGDGRRCSCGARVWCLRAGRRRLLRVVRDRARPRARRSPRARRDRRRIGRRRVGPRAAPRAQRGRRVRRRRRTTGRSRSCATVSRCRPRRRSRRRSPPTLPASGCSTQSPRARGRRRRRGDGRGARPQRRRRRRRAVDGAPDRNGPSCTAVAAVWDGTSVTLGWAGDSRAYWVDGAASGCSPSTTPGPRSRWRRGDDRRRPPSSIRGPT